MKSVVLSVPLQNLLSSPRSPDSHPGLFFVSSSETITLRRLEPVLKRLKVTIVEVFGEGMK
jgi:hypothetical protein